MNTEVHKDCSRRDLVRVDDEDLYEFNRKIYY